MNNSQPEDKVFEISQNRSTGPRTEEGKQRSSQNAITHGLFSKMLLLPGESEEEFDKLLYHMKREYLPKGATEEELVLAMAQISWRRRRIPNLETRAVEKSLETGDIECKFLNTYGIYDQRLTRNFQSTLKTLKEHQAKRLTENSLKFRIAVMVHEYMKKKGIDWDPRKDGFVFSSEWLERQLALNDKFEEVFTNPNIRVTTKQMDEWFHKQAAVDAEIC